MPFQVETSVQFPSICCVGHFAGSRLQWNKSTTGESALARRSRDLIKFASCAPVEWKISHISRLPAGPRQIFVVIVCASKCMQICRHWIVVRLRIEKLLAEATRRARLWNLITELGLFRGKLPTLIFAERIFSRFCLVCWKLPVLD